MNTEASGFFSFLTLILVYIFPLNFFLFLKIMLCIIIIIFYISPLDILYFKAKNLISLLPVLLCFSHLWFLVALFLVFGFGNVFLFIFDLSLRVYPGSSYGRMFFFGWIIFHTNLGYPFICWLALVAVIIKRAKVWNQVLNFFFFFWSFIPKV